MNTTQTTLVIVIVGLLAGAGIYEARQVSQLRDRVQAFQLEQSEQNRQRQAEREESSLQMAVLKAEIEHLRGNTRELLLLRGEISALRQQVALAQALVAQAGSAPFQRPAVRPGESAAPLLPEPHPPGTFIPRDELEFAGYESPEAGIETVFWAMFHGTYEQAKDGVNREAGAPVDPEAEKNFEAERDELSQTFRGIQILARKDLGDGEVELKMKVSYDLGPGRRSSQTGIYTVSNQDGHWKLHGQGSYQPEWDDDDEVHSFVP